MIAIDAARCIRCQSCVRVCPMGVLSPGEDLPAVNEKRRCIRCMHCAAACPRQAVHFDGLHPEEEYPAKPEDALEALVKSRRSVRHFQERLPDRALIQWALDTAAWAPSGKNQHANGWTVLWGRAETDKVTGLVLDWCRDTGGAPELLWLARKGLNLITCGAPCVIVGWSPDDALNPVLDPAVALTTVELLLNQKGLSTCWGGYLRQITEASHVLQAELGIPEGAGMRCALMAGYADRERYPNIPYRPAAEALWVTAE